jgi:Flp pilus assembly protein TadD
LSWDDKFSVSSGFFVEKDKIATNIHGVAKTGPVYVTLRNEEAIWKVEEVTAFDVKNDLVILKIAGEGIPLPLGDSNVLQSGEPVVAVGYPGGGYKVTTGVIDSIRNGGKSIWMKVVISGGNSGGPALNSKGQVIGINTAVGEHYAYAMPSNALKALIAQLGSTEPLGKWRKRDHIRAHAYCIQGQQKYQSDRYPEALSHFDISIQLNPAFISAYKGRGSINANLGNHEEAVADYNTVIRLNPDDAAAYHNRGYAHFQLGKSKSSGGKAEEARKLYQAAVEDWTQAIKLVPEYTDVYNDRGVARLMLGDYEKAIVDFDKVIQINPKSAKSYYDRGRAKEALGQKEGAQMDFQKAKELDPDVGQ